MNELKRPSSREFQWREAVTSIVSVAAIVVAMLATYKMMEWWLLDDADVADARRTWSNLSLSDGFDEWLWLRHDWLIGGLVVLGALSASALFSWVHKRIRGFAVALFFVLSCASPLFLVRSSWVRPDEILPPDDLFFRFFPSPDGSFSIRLWIIISALQVLASAWFAWTHRRHIRRDALKYFHHFKPLSKTNFADDKDGGTSNDETQLKALYKGEVEGESTLMLLLVIVYGIVALSAVTVTYFIIGEQLKLTDDAIPFIFKNNEGFTAALSLLIIVLTSAAVPIYSNLVKKIDDEIDNFEQDISILTQNSNGLSIGADAMWKHFTDVGLPLFEEWRQSFRGLQERAPNFLAQTHFDDLFLPYLIYQTSLHEAGGSYDRKPPRLLDPFVSLVKELGNQGTSLDSLFQGTYEVTQQRLADGTDFLFQSPEPEHSRRRVRGWVTDWYLDGDEFAENHLDESQQVHRARMLKFMAFKLQGADAIAGWSTSSSPFREFYRATGEEDAALRVGDTFIPSSERIIFALIHAHPELLGEFHNAGEGAQTSLTRFRSRIQRHLSDIVKAEGNFPSADRLNRLIETCDRLDIDASVFWDDVILFQQFAWASQSTSDKALLRAAMSRFLYYVIWYFSSFNTSTRIGQLLAFGPGDGVSASGDTSAPVGARDVQSRLEELHTRLRNGHFDGDSEASRFVSLLLADQRSALHNWIRASQALRSRQALREFEKMLDDIKSPRQLGIPIIPCRALRIRHLRYIVRSPRSAPARHALRLVSTFDLPTESVSQAREKAMSAEFDRRLISVQFKQLRDQLKFSNSWVKDTGIHSTQILEPFLAAKRTQKKIEIQLPSRLRTYLEWICKVFGYQGIIDLMDDFDLLDLGLQKVSHRYCALYAPDCLTSANWQREQWGHLFAYCAKSENHLAIKASFFEDPGTGEQSFREWHTYFTVHLASGLIGKN